MSSVSATSPGTTRLITIVQRRRKDVLVIRALQVGIVIIVAGIWEAVSRFGVLNPSEFPPFTVVVGAFGSTVLLPATWIAIGQTVLGWALALALSLAVGVSAGLLIGPSRFLTRSTGLIIDVLRSTPSPAIIFILILLLGTTLPMKVALGFFAAVFPILIQTLYGVRALDPVLRDLQRTYRLRSADAYFRIRLPAALPYIATGTRVSASLALIVVVVGEYLGGAPGVGSLVDRVRLIGDFPQMYALILLVGFLSIGLNAAVGAGESRLLRWHPSHRKGN